MPTMDVEPTKLQRSRKPLVASITEETSQDDDDEIATVDGDADPMDAEDGIV